MAKTVFAKQALTPDQLLAKLISQGLVVTPGNQSLAENYFQYVGGYRLKGYWYKIVNPATKNFPQGYQVTQLIERVEFDRQLRALASQAIEVLEIAIRSVISNTLSTRHHPHWFLRHELFKPTKNWGLGQLIKKIEDEVHRSERHSVHRYFNNHDDPYLPPSWSITECVTFGLWSRTYAILRDPRDKKVISLKFGIDKPEVFESWLHSLAVIRNAVAHHSQLLGNKMGVSPAGYRSGGIRFSDNQSFFAMATVMNFLLLQTHMPQTWKADLQALFQKYPDISISELGFPPRWHEQPGW